VSGEETDRSRPHWSEVLGDVADLGARVEAARQHSLTAAAEGSTTGLMGGTSVFTIGEPPPRMIRRRVAAPRPAPDVLDSPTVRIAVPPVPAPPRAPGTPQIGTPPPRMPAGGRTTAPAPAPEAPPAPPAPPPEAPAEAPSGGRRLLKDNLVVAAGTALSRITGVARLLAVYGLAVSLRDVYLQANNTPNIVYELILGGILTATLVPLFTQHLEEHDEEATSAVVSTTLVALVGLTLVALVVAPALIFLYGSNVDPDIDESQYLRVGVYLSVLFVPQVFFYGAMALGSSLLNARRRFFAAAWAPVLNNLIVVTVLLVAARMGSSAPTIERVDDELGLLLLLGLGTTSGIAAMALSLLPALRRAGVRIRFRPSLRHPAVRAAGGLSGWTLGYVIANQVAAQTVIVLANGVEGTFTTYQVGFIFFQLPHGLLAVSLMTTFQPDLARAFVQRAWPQFHARLLQGLRLLVSVMVPAAVGYLTLALLVVALGPDTTLFGPGGRFDQAVPIARALAGFAPGLLGFSVYLFVLRGFYAVQDTRRPFWINAAENVVNIVLALVLIVPLPLLTGLTVAYSIAYISAAALAIAVLLRRLPKGFDLRGFVATLLRCLAAAAAMAAAVTVTVLALTRLDDDLLAPGLLVAWSWAPWSTGSRRWCWGSCATPAWPGACPARSAGWPADPGSRPLPSLVGRPRYTRPMIKLFRRFWKYLGAGANQKFNEKADPKIQLQQAIDEAQRNHRVLTEQAANVIAQQKLAESRLTRSLEQLEKLNANARQAIIMAEEASKAGDATKAAEYTQAAETIANQLITTEAEVEELKAMALSGAQASDQAKAAVSQNGMLLQRKLAEQQKLMSQLEQAKMQEQMNTAMASLSATVGEDVPTFNEIRDKIEARHAQAKGMSELQGQSVEGRMLEVEQAAQNTQAQARLAQLKSELGLGGTTAPATGPDLAKPAEAPASQPQPGS
jgi:putative peptidoglycan lipid II flippase